MNAQKFYMRYVENEEKIDISFLLKVGDNMRQFNFSRNPTENVQSLLSRIDTNIAKVINKANKKKGMEKTEVKAKIFDENHVPLMEKSTCLDLFSMEQPIKLQIYDHVYETVFNSPWVLSLQLPQSMLADFSVYPEDFKSQFTKVDKCIFNWYRGSSRNEKGNAVSDVHIKWEFIGDGLFYTPTIQDIGMKLKLECIPGNDTMLGPAFETISKNVIEAGPGRCPFETRHMFTTENLKNESFRCVTYNILADLYCDSDYTKTVLHPYCPPYALHIDYRKQLVLKELLGYNADIICLQEVDLKIFRNCLKPRLETHGLEGLFYKKGKEVAEGLALFFRKDRFCVLEQEHILLAEAIKSENCLQPIWNNVKENQPLLERLLNRSTVASATIIQSCDNPEEILVVGNTHLYYHPDADHIRLIQGGIIIYWLMDLRKKMTAKFPDKRISTMICGDFNSVPSCGIYKLYTTGICVSSLPDWKSNLNEAVHDLSLKQDIPLESACGTPPYTNFTAGFADCLDYIFYEKTHLQVEQVIPLPSVEELTANTALPSIVFPSDHIALVSDLQFKCKK